MKSLKKIIQDKTTNHIVVAILVGFGAANFILSISQWWNAGPVDYWHGQIIRNIIGFIVILLLAEIIAGRAKN